MRTTSDQIDADFEGGLEGPPVGVTVISSNRGMHERDDFDIDQILESSDGLFDGDQTVESPLSGADIDVCAYLGDSGKEQLLQRDLRSSLDVLRLETTVLVRLGPSRDCTHQVPGRIDDLIRRESLVEVRVVLYERGKEKKSPEIDHSAMLVCFSRLMR